MAAAQGAEQKLSAEQEAAAKKAEEAKAAKTAEEAKAAEAKADADRLAAEIAAADLEAERVAAAEKAAHGRQVIGPVAVLPLKSGGERYVYRGTPVGDEFTAEGIKHAEAVGLVGKPKK